MVEKLREKEYERKKETNKQRNKEKKDKDCMFDIFEHCLYQRESSYFNVIRAYPKHLALTVLI